MKFYRILFPVYNFMRTFFRLKKKIKGTGNRFLFSNVFTSKSQFEIVGNGNVISFGSSSKIGNTKVYILGNNNTIAIGENCRILGSKLWIEDNNCVIKIGNNCSIEYAQFNVTEDNSSITMGDDCFVSYDIDIRTGDSHSIIDTETDKRINYAKNVVIGNHVWILAKVTILKGVTIGNNIILGKNSIITSDCPSNTLVAGIPAKIIKWNIDWKKERI